MITTGTLLNLSYLTDDQIDEMREYLPYISFPSKSKGIRAHLMGSYFTEGNEEWLEYLFETIYYIKPKTYKLVYSLPVTDESDEKILTEDDALAIVNEIFERTDVEPDMWVLNDPQDKDLSVSEACECALAYYNALRLKKGVSRILYLSSVPSLASWNEYHYLTDPNGKYFPRDWCLYNGAGQDLQTAEDMMRLDGIIKTKKKFICTGAGLVADNGVDYEDMEWWSTARIERLKAMLVMAYSVTKDFCCSPLWGNQSTDGSSWGLWSNAVDSGNPQQHPIMDWIVRR